MELKVGQLVRCDGLSTFVGMILSIYHDKILDRERCLVLWNDGVITTGWMDLTPIC